MQIHKDLQALVFDAFGTLFHIGSLNERLTHHFGEQAELVGEIWRNKQLEYTWLRTLMGLYEPFSRVTEDALRFACRSQSIVLTEAVLADLVAQYGTISTFPEVQGLLPKLAKSYRLAVLSNGNPEMLSKAVAENGILEFFEGVYSVDKVRVFKPHPSVYQIAVNALDLDKEKIGFISTNTWDVAGASAFGLKAIHLNRFNKVQDELGIAHAPHIDSLQQLLE